MGSEEGLGAGRSLGALALRVLEPVGRAAGAVALWRQQVVCLPALGGTKLPEISHRLKLPRGIELLQERKEIGQMLSSFVVPPIRPFECARG